LYLDDPQQETSLFAVPKYRDPKLQLKCFSAYWKSNAKIELNNRIIHDITRTVVEPRVQEIPAITRDANLNRSFDEAKQSLKHSLEI
jgi:hypothetical protein